MDRKDKLTCWRRNSISLTAESRFSFVTTLLNTSSSRAKNRQINVITAMVIEACFNHFLLTILHFMMCNGQSLQNVLFRLNRMSTESLFLNENKMLNSTYSKSTSIGTSRMRKWENGAFSQWLREIQTAVLNLQSLVRDNLSAIFYMSTDNGSLS